jgi:hypothetical protein
MGGLSKDDATLGIQCLLVGSKLQESEKLLNLTVVFLRQVQTAAWHDRFKSQVTGVVLVACR